MKTHLLASLVLAALWSAPHAALASERSIQKKATKAAYAADHNDLAKALKLGVAVLNKEPGNLDAAWAVGFAASQIALNYDIPKEDRARLTEDAVGLLGMVGQDRENTVRAAMARGIISDLTGATYALPQVQPACSDDAQGLFNAAEVAFSQEKMDEARGLYQRAIDACPTNALWVVFMGDTWMHTDTAKALETYRQALAIDPCQPQAHRFAADVLLSASQVSDVITGAAEAASAVACDPTYDEGWATFHAYVEGIGQQIVPRTTAADDPEGFQRYQEALAAVPPGDDPLQRREAAIREVFKQGPPATPLWNLLLDASGKEMLQEAILFELVDAELEGVFLAGRTARLERMKMYVLKVHVKG